MIKLEFNDRKLDVVDARREFFATVERVICGDVYLTDVHDGAGTAFPDCVVRAPSSFWSNEEGARIHFRATVDIKHVKWVGWNWRLLRPVLLGTKAKAPEVPHLRIVA